LVRSVAVATRTRRGLPRSARSFRGVPSLIPRESASALSRVPDAFCLRQIVSGSTSPFVFTSLRLGLLRATARRFAAAGLPSSHLLFPLLLVPSRHPLGDLASRMLDSSR